MKGKKRIRSADVAVKAGAHSTQDEVGVSLAKAFGGGNSNPAWKRMTAQTVQEEREERLKYQGGPTGEKLERA